MNCSQFLFIGKYGMINSTSYVRDSIMQQIEKITIKKLEIKGFKSIEHLILEDVSPFVVLAGANGSGKSNIVDALYFLSLVIKFGIDEAIEKIGGVSCISSNFIKTDVCYCIDVGIDKINYQYCLELNISESSAYIRYENFKISIYGRIVCDYDKKKKQNREKYLPKSSNKSPIGGILGVGGVVAFVGAVAVRAQEELYKVKKTVRQYPTYDIPKKCFLADMLIKEGNLFFKIMNNIRLYRFDLTGVVQSGDLELTDNRQGIISLLTCLEQDSNLKETVLEWLSLMIPDLQDIQQLNDKSFVFIENNGQTLPAHMVSNGTKYILYLLVTILKQTQEAGVTIIEEPERSLHPKVIGELIDFMREHTSINHPIILTTHSESVVRKLELEELFFVHKENGKTYVKSVKDSGVDKRKIPLNTAWLTNLFDGGLPW